MRKREIPDNLPALGSVQYENVENRFDTLVNKKWRPKAKTCLWLREHMREGGKPETFFLISRESSHDLWSAAHSCIGMVEGTDWEKAHDQGDGIYDGTAEILYILCYLGLIDDPDCFVGFDT